MFQIKVHTLQFPAYPNEPDTFAYLKLTPRVLSIDLKYFYPDIDPKNVVIVK